MKYAFKILKSRNYGDVLRINYLIANYRDR